MDEQLGSQGLARLLRHIPNAQRAGLSVKDITPILRHPQGLHQVLDTMIASFRNVPIDVVVGVEAGGILFAAPLAYILKVGLVLVRRPGKLPYETLSVGPDLEHGVPALEIHRDAIRPGLKVLIVDDILATGRTARAAASLVEQTGGEIAGLSFLLDLGLPEARVRLPRYRIAAVIL